MKGPLQMSSGSKKPGKEFPPQAGAPTSASSATPLPPAARKGGLSPQAQGQKTLISTDSDPDIYNECYENCMKAVAAMLELINMAQSPQPQSDPHSLLTKLE